MSRYVIREHLIFDTKSKAYIGAGDTCYLLNEARLHAEKLAEACKETLDALYNETAGNADTPWIAGIKTKATAALADWSKFNQ